MTSNVQGKHNLEDLSEAMLVRTQNEQVWVMYNAFISTNITMAHHRGIVMEINGDDDVTRSGIIMTSMR